MEGAMASQVVEVAVERARLEAARKSAAVVVGRRNRREAVERILTRMETEGLSFS